MIGRTLGHYRIESNLGAGGMGEVYQARDTKLQRDVAIKVLPEALAHDAERLKRLEREAQLLALLNHPNIAAIYGLEDFEGVRFLVLELVSGETLREWLARERPPLREAIDICRQIAEALEAAHQKGVVHRDLKPANINVTPDGKVKVLDFGLARAFATDELAAVLSGSPTVPAPATREGVILGTVAYMSPEQARGKTVDRRTDVWALGCVLYETLTRRQAFGAESVSESMAAILRGEPDWSLLPADTPDSIRRLLRRCLAKEARQRLHDAADARLELEEALSGGPAGAETPALAPGRRRFLAWVVGAILLAVISFGAALWRLTAPERTTDSWSGELLGGSPIAFGPRISPDGQTLAFQAMVEEQNQVALLKPASGHWSVLTADKSAGLIFEMCWSPDGTRIYYDRSLDVPLGIYSVPVVGGEPRLVLEGALAPQALPDGSLLVTRMNPERRNQLYRFWPQTGRIQALPALPCSTVIAPPVRVYPDGKEAVFFGRPLEASVDSPQHLYAIDLDTGATRRLAPGVTIPVPPEYFALAVHPDGRSVLIDLPGGNLHRVVAVPRDGSASVRTLMTLTMGPWFMDVGPDGSLYLDQLDRPAEVLRFSRAGGVPERIAASPTYVPYMRGGATPLPDGRVLIPTVLAGQERLLVAAPGKGLLPFVDTQEETAVPVAMVGQQAVAFLIGSGPDRAIAIASLPDGRIVRRLKGATGVVDSLASSPLGETLYFVSSGAVWELPTSDGAPRKIRAGDGVVVDPRNGDLIVKLNGPGRIRLLRLPTAGGPEREIPFRTREIGLTPVPLSPNAVGQDGRMVLQVFTLDSWFYGVAMLDPESGEVERIPAQYAGDIAVPGWADRGQIVSIGIPLRASVWRFQQVRGW